MQRTLGLEDLKTKGFPDMEIISMGQWQSIFQMYGPKGTNSKNSQVVHFTEKDSVEDDIVNITKNRNIVLSENENIENNEILQIYERDVMNDGTHGSKIPNIVTPEESLNHHRKKMEKGEEEEVVEVEVEVEAFEIKLTLNDDNYDDNNGNNDDHKNNNDDHNNNDNDYNYNNYNNNHHTSEKYSDMDLESNFEKKSIQNNKAGPWICTPSYCKACQHEIEKRIDDIHSNFQNIIFDVTILQPDLVDNNILEITTGNVIPMDDSTKDGDNSMPTAVSTGPQYNRRNPARVRSSRRGLKVVKVSLSSTDLISNVKIKLAEKVDEDTFRGLAGHVLMYGGMPMTDNQLSLRDYKVKSGETLCLQIVRNTSANGDGDIFALLSSITNKSGYFSEKGFQGSFLSGSGLLAASSANVSTSFSPSTAHIDTPIDIEDSVIHVDTIDPRSMEISMKQIIEFTGCTFDVARKMLIKCQYNVNEACAVISDEM